MRRSLSYCAGLALAVAAASSPRIKHIIVLMEENRSFDHMLGHLWQVDPRIDGLNGSQTNPVNPADPNSPRVPITYDAVDGGPSTPTTTLIALPCSCMASPSP